MELRDDPVLTAAGVTGREAEVLAMVGRRLGNREIAAELGISIRTVESHIAALRAKLRADDRSTLRQHALAAAAHSTGAGVPPVLVGRDDELAAVRDLLDDAGLVTLLGPGGSGKTSLARVVAASWDSEQRLVDLVPVAPDEVGAVIDDALGIGAGDAATRRGRVRLALAGRRVLLVLDDCEHVAAAVAAHVGPILGTGVPLRVLATSRQRLALPAERVVQVDPLPLPGDDTVPAVHSSPACGLFAARAAAVRAGFRIDRSNAATVAAICTMVDGLPLAIELAAAVLHTVGLDELARLLAARSAPLAQRGRAPRHRTMRAAIGWSWSLLAPAEQVLLGRLAALPSGLRLADLDGVAQLTAPPVGDLPSVLARLVDRSMIVARRVADGDVRYEVLETIRAFALAEADPTDMGAVRRDAAGAARDRLAVGVRRARAGTIAADPDGHDRRAVAAALTWAAVHDPALACDLLVSVAQRYELDPTRALLDTVRAVVERHALPEGWPSRPLAWAGALLNYLDLGLLVRCADAATARARSDDDRAVAAWARGFAVAYGDAPEQAAAVVAPAREHFAAAGDLFMVGHCAFVRGVAERDPATAVDELERCMLAFLRADAPWHANAARLLLVRRALEAGVRIADIAIWLEDCASFAARHGLVHDGAHAVLARATYAAACGRHGEAGMLAERAAATFRRVGDLRCLGRALLCRADARDDPPAAVQLSREAVAVAVAQDDRPAQVTALRRLSSFAAAAGDDVLAARALGAAAAVAGDDPPVTGPLAGRRHASVIEGHAAGPALVVDI